MKAKDINSQRFEKAAFGYKQEDIDEFLNELAADYSQLEKDNEEINTKLQVLADKVREYRKDEDAVKDALLFAQKEGHRVLSEAKEKADSIVNNAKLEGERIISEATIDSQKAIDEIRIQLKNEQASLTRMKKQVSEFKKDLFDLYKSHLELISSIPQLDEEEEEPEYDEAEEAVSEPETVKSVQVRETAPEPQAFAAAPVKTVKKEEETIKPDPFRTQSIPVIGTPDNRYAELQFGNQKK
ncbi:MAG: DivIVA domain-containing protein [Oscillospiraceae bacterium]|nr:DivIVA domain-containing protein [Oscillospiraceae bacterium]